MNKDKKQISVYKINLEHKIFEQCSNNLQKLIEKIKENKKYHFQDLQVQSENFINYTAFAVYIINNQRISWGNFLNSILLEPKDWGAGKNHSAILLLENKNSHNIYAITFGPVGYFLIKEFIQDSFGIDILSRLQQPNNLACKTTKSQSLVGAKQGEISVYRDFHNLEETLDDFGKIFQELMIALNETLLNKFGITVQEGIKKKQKNCLVKDSFKINSAIESKTIEKILDGCEWALTQPQYPINAVKMLNKKKDKELIAKLNSACYVSIHKLFNNANDSWSFNICHKDYDKYFHSDSYQLQGAVQLEQEGVVTTLRELFEKLKKTYPNLNPNAEELGNIIEKSYLNTLNDEGQIQTSDTVKKHLFHEEKIDGYSYFLLNDIWYRLEKPFLDDLNKKIISSLPRYTFNDSKFLQPWNNSTNETNYILQHKNLDNTIIIHPNTVRNIELCDMIHWNERNLYLYFIKQGFGNEIRSLSSQILVSAKLIFNEKKTHIDYLEKLFEQLYNIQATKLSKDTFIKLFSKRIIFVFAFYDNKKSQNRILETEPNKFNSNIAKYSTLNLIKDMKDFDNFYLEIAQIKS